MFRGHTRKLNICPTLQMQTYVDNFLIQLLRYGRETNTTERKIIAGGAHYILDSPLSFNFLVFLVIQRSLKFRRLNRTTSQEITHLEFSLAPFCFDSVGCEWPGWIISPGFHHSTPFGGRQNACVVKPAGRNGKADV